MLHHRSTRRAVLGLLAVVFGGLGIGFASNLFAPSRGGDRTESPATESAGGWSPVVAAHPAERPRGEPQAPAQPDGAGKHALLVGVTTYDNLAPASHLSGPGNDARLMRRTLVEQYHFPAANVVSLTDDEGKPELRPTRANIAREFKRLAEAARAGDQVVVLLAGHGDRQPESDPPDPVAPEPDGLDEIFLPADVKPWAGYPARVPNAIADKELRDWLAAITAKKAYVWAVFDCCHSGSMTRDGEVVRQLPPSVLVPPEELTKARERAAKRTGRAAPEPGTKGKQLASTTSEHLVATFACREYETTPESPQPADSVTAKPYGLLTYTLVSGLEKSAASGTSLTYRELMQRVQASYLARPQGAPTPTTEGAGQDRVVLGTDKPSRPKIALTRIKGEYVVNVGDLHGITSGSILRVYSPAGEKEKPRVLGHVRVEQTRPLDSVVVAVAHDNVEKPATLPATGLCEVVAVDYAVNRALLVGIADGKGQEALKPKVTATLRALPKEEAGLFSLVDDLSKAHFVVRVSANGTELQELSGNRPPIPLAALGSDRFGETLVAKLKAIHRARSLIEVGVRLQSEKSRDTSEPEVKIEVIGHRNADDPGRVLERPSTGWVFRPGDRISFRVTNTSKTKRLEINLLLVDPDYRIGLFYPPPDETSKILEPGAVLKTVAGTINDEPPFGPESMVAIITSPTKPSVNYGLLTQQGVRGSTERGDSLNSPIAQLLDRGMHGHGTRNGLTRAEIAGQGAQVMNWRTEPAPKKK